MDESIAAKLGEALRRRGWFITTAESCTGGGVAAAITDIAGSSAWFAAAHVTYSNRAKMQLLGVDKQILITEGAVSEAVVVAMATGALERTSAHLAIALSGIAGPGGGTADKPVGTVWIAWRAREQDQEWGMTECVCFEGDRRAVREQSIEHALNRAFELLNKTV